MLEEPLPISQSLDRPAPTNSARAGGHQDHQDMETSTHFRKQGASVAIPRAPIDPCVDNALGPVNGLDMAKWQNGRHEMTRILRERHFHMQ